MDKIKIGIIDSGVNIYHPAVKELMPVVIDEEVEEKSKDYYGHGTAVFNIVGSIGNMAEIVNFKLNDVENGASEKELISILKIIKDNYSFDIINLSLGISICEEMDELYAICKEITDAGSIIVSAFDNAGSISYPAEFENVIGVTTGENCIKISDFEYVEDTAVNLCAKGNIQRVAWNNPDYIMLGGNSFACAHVTVQVAKFMIAGIRGYDAIMAEFKKIARVIHSNGIREEKRDCQRIPYVIKKAVLFPFNKEMHGLIRFSDNLKYEIVGVYDSKYSANVGSTTDHIMKDDVESILIENIADIQWDKFDTLIVGHLDEMSKLIDCNRLKDNLIREAMARGKNIYAFDDLGEQWKNNKVFSPSIKVQDLPQFRFGKLYRYQKPIVGIYGTSSKQGKFTLQLVLRNYFLKKGYKVGQIGTEPSALLYGMDYVYPMGYNNSVYIQDYAAIRYLNYLMGNLCKKDVDIIITGSQSGVLPYDTGNLNQYSLPQVDFLLGTQPDSVVLCINPYDEYDYIQRTINFIEAAIDCDVIALVVFPMDLKNDWTGIYGQKEKLSDEKYEKIASDLSQLFGVPILNLGRSKDMERLGNVIVDYFSQDND